MKNMNENGRSMVEMLGVLAIIGVLSAGGLAGYSKAMYKYRVNETMNQLTMIVSNIRTTFGSQNKYTGLGDGTNPMTADNALKYGIITQEMKNGVADGATAQNPFKGKVLIGSANGRAASGNDEEAFYIEYDNLPAEACVTIVTSDWGAGAGSGLIGIAAHNVGGKDAYTAGTANTSLTRPAATQEGAPTAAKLSSITITEASSRPFTIAQAVAACRGADGADTSANASIALKYY